MNCTKHVSARAEKVPSFCGQLVCYVYQGMMGEPGFPGEEGDPGEQGEQGDMVRPSHAYF